MGKVLAFEKKKDFFDYLRIKRLRTAVTAPDFSFEQTNSKDIKQLCKEIISGETPDTSNEKLNKPLHLSLNNSACYLLQEKNQQPEFSHLADKVLQRDSYTCQYCKFKAFTHQQVINENANTNDGTLHVACVFCLQCLFLKNVGVSGSGGGTLIHLPDITQGYLNGLLHVLFCAIENETVYTNIAKDIYGLLLSNTLPIEKKLGKGMSNPKILCKTIQQAKLTDEQIQLLFKDMRLIPHYSAFKPIIHDWCEAALMELDIEN